MQLLRLFIVLTLLFSPYAGASFSISDNTQPNERILSVATDQLMQSSCCESQRSMTDLANLHECADFCHISCCTASVLLVIGENLMRVYMRNSSVESRSAAFRSISVSPEIHPPL